MKKPYIILVIVAALAAFGWFQIAHSPSESLAPSNGTPQNVGEIITAPSAPSSDSISYAGVEGRTALELLQENAEVEVSGSGENAFVTAIDGRVADSEQRKYWSFWVNGEMAQVGAGSYVTKDGDMIEWRIETY